MENKLDWMKDLMSLNSQSLKLLFSSVVKQKCQIEIRPHIIVQQCKYPGLTDVCVCFCISIQIRDDMRCFFFEFDSKKSHS